MKIRKKTTATILIAIFVLSIFTVAIPIVSAATITVAKLGTPDYSTIQAAITAASGVDIITVAAGTYAEDLVIPAGKDGLELSGATGAIIKGVAVGTGDYELGKEGIRVQSNDVKIHGFTIESPTTSTGEQSAGVVFEASGLEIYDNDFVFVGAGESLGIGSVHYNNIPTVDIDGLSIRDNTFSGTPTQEWEGIYLNQDVGTDSVSIEDNTFTGNLFRAITCERSKATIDGNTMTSTTANVWGFSRGIDVCQFPTVTMTDIDVTNNDISGFTWGINFGDGAQVNTLSGVLAEGNTIDDATIGVSVRGATAVGVVVNYNDLLDGGITEAAAAGTLDAEYNWWGTSVGADIALMVSGDVDYVPWLSESPIGVEVIVEPATYTLTLTIVESGTVVIDTVTYSEGVNTITLANAPVDPVYSIVASGEDYWKFVEWTVDLTGTDPSTSLTLTGDMDVTATFVPKTVSIVVPGSVNFGTVLVGTNSEVETIAVQNTGEVDVAVTADTADAWYQMYLQIGPNGGSLSAYASGWTLGSVGYSTSEDYDLQLVNVAGLGSHDAVLVLTATPTEPI